MICCSVIGLFQLVMDVQYSGLHLNPSYGVVSSDCNDR